MTLLTTYMYTHKEQASDEVSFDCAFIFTDAIFFSEKTHVSTCMYLLHACMGVRAVVCVCVLVA